MARPLDGVAPKNQTLNCKLTESENNELGRIVRESNISKSNLIRTALKIIFTRANEVRKKARKDAEKMIKEGKLSFDNMHTMYDKYGDELELELNKMAYDKVLEADKKKQKKMKQEKKNNS